MSKIIFLFPLWISLIPENIQNKYYFFFRVSLCLVSVFVFLKYPKKYLNYLTRDFKYWIYLFSLTLSFIFAQNQTIGISRLHKLILDSLFIYFFLAYTIIMHKRKIIITFSLLGIIVALIGFLELIHHKNLIYETFISNPFYMRYLQRYRIMSTQLHPSVLGTYFLAILPLVYYLIFSTKTRLKNLGIISSAIIWSGLILTFARSAIIGAIVSLMIFLWQRNYRKWLVKIIGGILLFIFLFTFFTNKLSILHKNFLDLWIKRSSIAYRLERVPTVFKMLKDHPFTGVGIENFRYLFDKYHRYSNVPYEFKIPDNMYLMFLAETGLIGFIAFLYFLISLLKRSFKISFSDEDNKLFLRLCVCALGGLLFNMFSYDLFYWNMPFCFFWMYAGIINNYSDFPTDVKED